MSRPVKAALTFALVAGIAEMFCRPGPGLGLLVVAAIGAAGFYEFLCWRTTERESQ